jgi:hypothetical protein
MKLTLTATLALTYFTISTINAQVVSCPLTIPVEKDSTTEVWGLQTAGQTPYLTVGNFRPNSNVKEGYQYSDWVPLNSQLTTEQEINTVFVATQNRVNPQVGLIEMSSYYCVYTLKGRNKKEKK